MDPEASATNGAWRRFPRTRGDGPEDVAPQVKAQRVSPHTRGWTLVGVHLGERQPGFPAHAGMDPAKAIQKTTDLGFPRTRGDGPVSNAVTASASRVFPAHAGMDLDAAKSAAKSARFPRTRGDGPALCDAIWDATWVSPHTRGWTRCHSRAQFRLGGFPAHAGMGPWA